MSTPTTQSDLLLAAADRVRDLAAGAVPGPWDSALAEVDHAGPFERELVADCGDSRTADWIAAMSPAIASALEEWLRDEAYEIQSHEETINREWAALRLARLLVGGS